MWNRQEWAFLGTAEDHRTSDSRAGSEGISSRLPTPSEWPYRPASLWYEPVPTASSPFYSSDVGASCQWCSKQTGEPHAPSAVPGSHLGMPAAEHAGTQGCVNFQLPLLGKEISSLWEVELGCSLILIPTRVSLQRPLRQYPLVLPGT